jgi:hypothetical protein
MKKLLAIAAAVTLLSFTCAGAAHADTTTSGTATITLTTGALTISGGVPYAFGSHVLTGGNTTYSANIGALSVTDATGSGSGWNVTASTGQTTLTTGGSPSYSLGDLTIDGSNSTVCVASNTCDTPTFTGGSGGSLLTNTSVKVDTSSGAAAGGPFTVSFASGALTVAVPANSRAGTYTTTLTFTVAPGA